MAKDFYSTYASYYDEANRHRDHVKEVGFLKAVFKKFKVSGRILDLGCGTGTHSIMLKKEGFDVLGMDFSEPMLELAEKKSKSEIKFIERDVRELDDVESFGAVFTSNTPLVHISRDEVVDVIRRVSRSLRDGGVFVIDTKNNFIERDEQLFNLIHAKKDKNSKSMIFSFSMNSQAEQCMKYRIIILSEKDGRPAFDFSDETVAFSLRYDIIKPL